MQIVLKKSENTGEIPTTDDLVRGELAVNTADGRLFLKKNDDSVVVIGEGTGSGIPEAPIDGKQYGRQDAAWSEITGGASFNGNLNGNSLYDSTGRLNMVGQEDDGIHMNFSYSDGGQADIQWVVNDFNGNPWWAIESYFSGEIGEGKTNLNIALCNSLFSMNDWGDNICHITSIQGNPIHFDAGIDTNQLLVGGNSYPSDSGNNGQILTTNGAGVAQWADPGALNGASLHNTDGDTVNVSDNLSILPSDSGISSEVRIKSDPNNGQNESKFVLSRETGGEFAATLHSGGVECYLNDGGGNLDFSNQGTGSISFYTQKDGNIDFKPGNWESDPTGRVGFYGNYFFPRSDGTNAQVLTTDGAGNVYWADGGSGGDGADPRIYSQPAEYSTAPTGGSQALAIGDGAIAAGLGGVALGNGSSAGGSDAVAVGRNARATSSFSIGIGGSAQASNSIIVGNASTTTDQRVIGIGTSSIVGGSDSIYIGDDFNSGGGVYSSGNVVIGQGYHNTLRASTLVGSDNTGSTEEYLKGYVGLKASQYYNAPDWYGHKVMLGCESFSQGNTHPEVWGFGEGGGAEIPSVSFGRYGRTDYHGEFNTHSYHPSINYTTNTDKFPHAKSSIFSVTVDPQDKFYDGSWRMLPLSGSMSASAANNVFLIPSTYVATIELSGVMYDGNFTYFINKTIMKHINETISELKTEILKDDGSDGSADFDIRIVRNYDENQSYSVEMQHNNGGADIDLMLTCKINIAERNADR